MKPATLTFAPELRSLSAPNTRPQMAGGGRASSDGTSAPCGSARDTPGRRHRPEAIGRRAVDGKYPSSFGPSARPRATPAVQACHLEQSEHLRCPDTQGHRPGGRADPAQRPHEHTECCGVDERLQPQPMSTTSEVHPESSRPSRAARRWGAVSMSSSPETTAVPTGATGSLPSVLVPMLRPVGHSCASDGVAAEVMVSSWVPDPRRHAARRTLRSAGPNVRRAHRAGRLDARGGGTMTAGTKHEDTASPLWGPLAAPTRPTRAERAANGRAARVRMRRSAQAEVVTTGPAGPGRRARAPSDDARAGPRAVALRADARVAVHVLPGRRA